MTTLLCSLAWVAAAGTARAEDQTFSATAGSAPQVSVDVELETEATWQTLIDQTFTVPYGLSYSPLFLLGNQGIHVDAMKVQLFHPAGTVCGANLYSLDVATSPNQAVLTRYFANASGEIALPNQKVYKALIILNQTLYVQSSCVVRLSAKVHGGGGGGGDPSGDYELAGVMRYEGGFRHRVTMTLSAPAKIVRFWARVPAFCGSLEVLEGGTFTEGVYDAARLVDAAKSVFEVNAGAGMRVSAVALSFNGPATQACDIPVYVLKD